jgi:hypothetical protein
MKTDKKSRASARVPAARPSLIEVGQVWEDADPRHEKARKKIGKPPRRGTVERIIFGGKKAVVAWDTGKRTWVDLERFAERSNGYRFVCPDLPGVPPSVARKQQIALRGPSTRPGLIKQLARVQKQLGKVIKSESPIGSGGAPQSAPGSARGKTPLEAVREDLDRDEMALAHRESGLSELVEEILDAAADYVDSDGLVQAHIREEVADLIRKFIGRRPC